CHQPEYICSSESDTAKRAALHSGGRRGVGTLAPFTAQFLKLLLPLLGSLLTPFRTKSRSQIVVVAIWAHDAPRPSVHAVKECATSSNARAVEYPPSTWDVATVDRIEAPDRARLLVHAKQSYFMRCRRSRRSSFPSPPFVFRHEDSNKTCYMELA